jgi:pilus assembly protein CpaB
MRRGSSSLLVILGLFVLLLAGAGAYLWLVAPDLVPGANVQALPPTPRPDVEVVEAALDIEQGVLISDVESMLTMGSISGDDYAANPGVYFTNPDEIRNLKAVMTIRGNTAVKRDQVGPAGLSLKIPTPEAGKPSLKAFPVQVNSLTGVGDLIQAGDFVDVMASFNMDVTTFRPGVPQNADNGTVQQMLVEQQGNEGSVKVLLQDVQVLDVIKPTPPPPAEEGQPEEAPAPTQEVAAEPTPQPQQIAKNTSATTLQAGNWLVVIAVTQQEAEVLRFTLDRGIGISTLLRATGDHATERTVGATMRILIDNYGMPLPSGNPPAQQPGPVQIPNIPSLPEKNVETWAPQETAVPNQ